MAYYGATYFGPTYYGNAYWGTGAAAVIIVDTHDGFDEKRHEAKRKQKERLRGQMEEAFRRAFEPDRIVTPTIARNDEPLTEFVFPAYREQPVEDDEEEAALLLLT